MINIDLNKGVVDISKAENKHDLFVLQSEILFVLGAFMNAKEEVEKKTYEPKEAAKFLTDRLIFAKQFFAQTKLGA